MTVLMLYMSVLTVFLPTLYWDAVRKYERRKECCLCCFEEDSSLFCKGRYLTYS